jgi:thioredoxin-related protein
MNAFYKKTELFANIAIILVAITLVVVLAKRFVFTAPAPNPPAENQQPIVGTKVSLPDIDWSKTNKNLLLVLSNTCKYCTESAPFYQRLAQERARRDSFHLTAVLPQSVDDGRKYLSGLGVSIDEVKQLSAGTLRIRGTPTLLLINSAGVVTDEWMGKLPPETEAEVLSRLQ